MSFRRTVTQDVEVSGHRFTEGEKVVMFFNSANRDERQFADPFSFDITRSPNAHFGYGGGGPHFCLGANLARRELRAIFTQLLRNLPGLEVTDEPDYLDSAFINGIKHLSVRVR